MKWFWEWLFTFVVQADREKLTVMAGDWNAIIEELDTTKNFQSKFCKVLNRLKNMSYIDSFRHFHLLSAKHKSGLSDHCQLEIELNLRVRFPSVLEVWDSWLSVSSP